MHTQGQQKKFTHPEKTHGKKLKRKNYLPKNTGKKILARSFKKHDSAGENYTFKRITHPSQAYIENPTPINLHGKFTYPEKK